MTRPFILVASYPKSGNTWTRIILERLIQGPDLPINSMNKALGGGGRRRIFDQFSPVDASDLLPDEIVGFHAEVYRRFAAVADGRAFIKVHEVACRHGMWIYPPECVEAVVYLVRHPFDVAVSAAHHFGQSVEKMVDFMADESVLPSATSWLPGVIPMPYGTWSENVLSWIDASPFRMEWARYEDIHADTLGQFMRLANVIGLYPEEAHLARVAEASRFDALKKEEEQEGFRERPVSSPRFFRSGRPGSWEGVLSRELREKIVRDHGPVMERLGYTADGGTLPLAAASVGKAGVSPGEQ